MSDLLPCPTPWCGSTTLRTTTFFKSYKDKKTDKVIPYVEVEHFCPACHVRTPQKSPEEATATWNDRGAA